MSVMLDAGLYRRSFAQDPSLKGRLYQLLETTFPGIGGQAERLHIDGGSWEQVSTPFVLEDPSGAIIAHVGVMTLPAIVAGERCDIGAVHAVCTHPDHRGRGCFRALMDDMLAWSVGRFGTLMLTTSQPDLYKRFGFRCVAEHKFELSASAAGRSPGMRAIDLRQAEDLALLQKLLGTREPVSSVFGVTGEERGSFSFYCPDTGLWFAAAVDTIAWLELDGVTLRIHDLIAPRIPPLAALLERLPFAIGRVETLFATDRLLAESRAIPYRHEGGHLMIRGPFAVEHERFMVPPAARC